MRQKNKKRTVYLTDDPILIYKGIIDGSYFKFPQGFVDIENMKILVRYVFLEQLKYSREDICNITQKDLHKYRLSSFLKITESLYEIIDKSFPEMNIKEWELKTVPNLFWNCKENRKNYFLWLCDMYELDITSKEDLKKINVDFIRNNQGKKCSHKAGGIYNLIREVTGTDYKQWEICKINKWNIEMINEAIIWLVEEKLCFLREDVENYRDKEIRALIKREDIIYYDLYGILIKKFRGSVVNMIRFVYKKNY